MISNILKLFACAILIIGIVWLLLTEGDSPVPLVLIFSSPFCYGFATIVKAAELYIDGKKPSTEKTE